MLKLLRKFLVATKVHNFKEAIKIKNKADMVFISNLLEQRVIQREKK